MDPLVYKKYVVYTRVSPRWLRVHAAVTSSTDTARNLVPQHQRVYQADPRPVYQRVPRSKTYFNAFMLVFCTGIFGISLGGLNMIRVSTGGSDWGSSIQGKKAEE